MGNCLVTKLKGTVDNDSLAKLGEIKAKWSPNDSISGELLVVGGNSSGITILTDPSVAWKQGKQYDKDNPLTLVNTVNSLAITETIEQNTVDLYIEDYYNLTSFRLSHCNIKSIDTATLLKYAPDLTMFGLYKTGIDGSLNDFITADNITELHLGPCTTMKDSNVRNFLNRLAERRVTGQLIMSASNGNVSGSVWTDIPAGFTGSYYNHKATVYFDTNYPHGWYIKAYSGTYYNANDEIITPQE